MSDFHVGDHVHILCHDGTAFTGRIDEIHDLYIVLGPPRRGFALDDIRTITHA